LNLGSLFKVPLARVTGAWGSPLTSKSNPFKRRPGSHSFAGDAGWRARQGTRPARFTGLALFHQARTCRPCPQHRPARDSGVCCGPSAATIQSCQCGV